jgi:outer membrane protein assembly factor BamB
MKSEDMVFVGIKGRVLGIDRQTGTKLWETRVKGSFVAGAYFVNIFFDRGTVLAAAGGILYCLDAATGRIKWENPLNGCGFGIATIASATGSSGNASSVGFRQSQDSAATAAT